ncbi:phosphoglycolate phosphatase [Brackiella oedipodis]|uniref:phosphoglycolate phosphatase n=1 Tax=Brackiella oedipodis TaxID=124225 RepID=UPI00048EE5A5|nr:phosphoglycolate phosphatase [Brackiella oedipodis]
MSQVSQPITTVLFDLDGTLVDSIPDLSDACNAMLHDLERPTLEEARISQFVGKGTDLLIKRCLANDSNPEEPPSEVFKLAKALFEKHYHKTNGQRSQLFPHIVEGLQALKQQGYLLAVVTNKPMQFTEQLLQHKQLKQFFELIVAGDSCERKKPHPDPILFACKQLQVRPSEAVFVGDSNNDAQAAAAAAMPCLILPYGYTEGEDVQTFKVSAIVNNILEVIDWLGQHSS